MSQHAWESPPLTQTHLVGVLWFLTATGLFSILFVSAKFIGDAISIYQLLFIRYAAGFVTIAITASITRQSVSSPKPAIHMVRALCGVGGGLCMIYATANMPVTDATAIGLLEGLVTVVFGIWFFKEIVTARQWLASFFCLVGAALMVAEHGLTGGVGLSYWIPAGLAFLAAVLIALEGVFIKVLVKREPAVPVLFYVNGFATLTLAVPAYLTWVPLDAAIAGMVALLGPMAVFAQYCNMRGYRLAPISIAGAVNYTWIIFAAFWGWVLFNEPISMTGVIAMAAILGGGIALARLRY